jgi:protein phosphatase
MSDAIRQSRPDGAVSRKPRDDELDVFGMTDTGRVRRDNQDHFLFCTLHKTLQVRVTSLANPELLEIPSERLASLCMVADGLGGREGGEAASRVTVETMAAYVNHAMGCYYRADSSDEGPFLAELDAAANACHQTVLARARELNLEKMATTLTMGLAVWPMLYLLQVGDSRAYRCRDRTLERLTKDQTMAQALLDQGVIAATDLERSPFRNVLSSAIGRAAQPVVSRHDLRRGDVLLLCSDGLTKHVPDERIAARLANMESAEQACRSLINDALEDGGTDNVTVLVARTITRPA